MSLRRILLTGSVVLLVAFTAVPALAQQWPAYPLPNPPTSGTWRGPGGYLSLIKLAVCFGLFLAWVRSTEWLSIDSYEQRLNYLRWNSIAFGSFLGAFILVWLIPMFWLSFPLLLAAYVGPLVAYVLERNKNLPAHKRVLTPDHLRHWFSEHMGKVGVKVEAEKKAEHEKGAPVKLTARSGATAVDDNARLLTARRAPGFVAAKQILYDGLTRRATSIMLDFTAEGVKIRHQIDGVWLDAPVLKREQADPALESLKMLCGADPKERVKRQEGKFSAEVESVGYAGTLTTQGVTGGERGVIQFEAKKASFENGEALGMRPKTVEQVKEVMARSTGLVYFSGLPGNGMRTTTSVVLRNTDRFTRDFAAIEENQHRYEVLDNIAIHNFDAAAGQTLMSILPTVCRTEPNALVVRDAADSESVRFLCKQSHERLIISSIRARDAAEALLRVMMLKVPPAEFGKAITAMVCVRLIRKLCEACKETYTPAPEALAQLGIPQGKIAAFYRPPEPQEKGKKPCKQCGGIGYVGRTGLFELLVVDDTVRKVLQTTPKLDLVAKAARAAGMHTFLEEGVLLVSQGVTSLAELSRALSAKS